MSLTSRRSSADFLVFLLSVADLVLLPVLLLTLRFFPAGLWSSSSWAESSAGRFDRGVLPLPLPLPVLSGLVGLGCRAL